MLKGGGPGCAERADARTPCCCGCPPVGGCCCICCCCICCRGANGLGSGFAAILATARSAAASPVRCREGGCRCFGGQQLLCCAGAQATDAPAAAPAAGARRLRPGQLSCRGCCCSGMHWCSQTCGLRARVSRGVDAGHVRRGQLHTLSVPRRHWPTRRVRVDVPASMRAVRAHAASGAGTRVCGAAPGGGFPLAPPPPSPPLSPLPLVSSLSLSHPEVALAYGMGPRDAPAAGSPAPAPTPGGPLARICWSYDESDASGLACEPCFPPSCSECCAMLYEFGMPKVGCPKSPSSAVWLSAPPCRHSSTQSSRPPRACARARRCGAMLPPLTRSGDRDGRATEVKASLNYTGRRARGPGTRPRGVPPTRGRDAGGKQHRRRAAAAQPARRRPGAGGRRGGCRAAAGDSRAVRVKPVRLVGGAAADAGAVRVQPVRLVGWAPPARPAAVRVRVGRVAPGRARRERGGRGRRVGRVRARARRPRGRGEHPGRAV